MFIASKPAFGVAIARQLSSVTHNPLFHAASPSCRGFRH
ncbi:uncharacterized protein EbC_43810 [Erwinia billingiae Eb661]|uniref:Uncharacterized protein n=1 Tax=Erwinia billingiae (strain Eb661) TaxID=634500 RepID=D8ML84_ERWBE|nr:uncharacterized protein EbC_43810 [Erwinia billingiae Eb661]